MCLWNTDAQGKICKSYILTLSQSKGRVIQMTCEQPFQWYEPRDVRVKVKSSKGNPGSTD